jgi:hypothetical protein
MLSEAGPGVVTYRVSRDVIQIASHVTIDSSLPSNYYTYFTNRYGDSRPPHDRSDG